MPPPKKTKKALPERPRYTPYSMKNPPPPYKYTPTCVYPEKTGSETRTFVEGQNVCARVNGVEKSARFVSSTPTGHRISFGQGTVSADIPWYDVGIASLPGKKKMVESTARQKNLPEDIERKLKTYLGGRSFTSHRLTKRNKRVKRK